MHGRRRDACRELDASLHGAWSAVSTPHHVARCALCVAHVPRCMLRHVAFCALHVARCACASCAAWYGVPRQIPAAAPFEHKDQQEHHRHGRRARAHAPRRLRAARERRGPVADHASAECAPRSRTRPRVLPGRPLLPRLQAFNCRLRFGATAADAQMERVRRVCAALTRARDVGRAVRLPPAVPLARRRACGHSHR